MKRLAFLLLLCLTLGGGVAVAQTDTLVSIDPQLLDYYRQGREHLIYAYDFGNGDSATNYYSFILSDYDRAFIGQLADALYDSNLSDEEQLASLLRFVQAIPYQTDLESKGVEEYVRYPIETLADRCGDCEDKSILLAALLDAFGYDYALVVYPDHLGAGVRFAGEERYRYLEATTSGWVVGQVPEEFEEAGCTLLPPVNGPLVVLADAAFESAPAVVGTKTECALRLHVRDYGPGAAGGMMAHVVMTDRRRVGESVLFDGWFELDDVMEAGEADYQLTFRSRVTNGSTLKVTLVGEDFDDIKLTMSLEGK